MARKRYISQDEWDDYLDLSDSHSEDFSDLSDSESDVHALYVASDTDKSSSDEDEEAATCNLLCQHLLAYLFLLIRQQLLLQLSYKSVDFLKKR